MGGLTNHPQYNKTMNERNNKRNSAQQVVEHLRHRALQSPQAERLAEYVANKFKTTGCTKVSIGWSQFSIRIDKEGWNDMGFFNDCSRWDVYYKRKDGCYYVKGDGIKEWRDVTDTCIPCKYATDALDLMEKYFILSNLGYIVKLCPMSIDIFLPQVDYFSYT